MRHIPLDEYLIVAAQKLGLRLEFVEGVGIWEAAPGYRHQSEVDRIRASIRRVAGDCACLHMADVDVRFPDGSLKRPDISIWCREPDELDRAVTLVPAAVIEVVSPGYERKDVVLGPPFYLKHGVRDVLVYDPIKKELRHSTEGGTVVYETPATLTLGCGCEVTV